MRDKEQKIAEELLEQQFYCYIPALILCPNTSELVNEVDGHLLEAK